MVPDAVFTALREMSSRSSAGLFDGIWRPTHSNQGVSYPLQALLS